jgi:hypothetical protein
VRDASRHPPEPRQDTPARGWETLVWGRILRRQRARRLGALAFAAVVLGGVCLVVLGRGAPESVAPRVRVALEGPRRLDGSTPVHAVWQVSYEGNELRVYRDDGGVLQRCPGSTGCSRTERGGTLELKVDAPGEYRLLVLGTPSTAPGLSLESDLMAARRRGDPVALSAPLIAY